MKRVAAGAFKARCLAIMKSVQATGEPIVVTKRGMPLVKLVPPDSEQVFGFMVKDVEIVGDVESPLVPLKYWKIRSK